VPSRTVPGPPGAPLVTPVEARPGGRKALLWIVAAQGSRVAYDLRDILQRLFSASHPLGL
jgi:hypothetical protein